MLASDKYFKVVSEFGNVIHINPRGSWNDEIAREYGQELKDKFSKAVDEVAARGRKFIVLANLSDFHIEGEKTKILLSELMKISVGNPMFFRTVQIITDPRTREEIMESVKRAGQENVRVIVGSMEEANLAIMDLKKELIRM